MHENNIEQTPETELELTIPEGVESVTLNVPEGVEVLVNQETKQPEPEEEVELKPWETPLTIGLVVALALAVIAVVIRKAKANKKAAAAPVVEEAPAPAPEAPKAPGSAGGVKLYNVEPKTAAMLMAIVADKLGKPLNELRFISIKEVE